MTDPQFARHRCVASVKPTVSVIVPTRDRVESLRRTIDALASQKTAREWELIVVDDGSDPPVDARILADIPCGKLLRGRDADLHRPETLVCPPHAVTSCC